MTNAEILPIATPITDALVQGALELETTARGVLVHRLPAWARSRGLDAQFAMVEAQPSGVRLVFRTRASAIELDTLPTRYRYAGVPARPPGVYDLLVDGTGARVAQASAEGGDTVVISLGTGAASHEPGAAATLRFAGLPTHDKRVELWLPHNEATLLVALRSDAALEPVGDDGRRVWLHHGSSISQGSNAASPTTIWPALAAARAGVSLLNLGFGGSALLDPFVARTIRDTRADLISLKLGINLVNADLMRQRAFASAVHGAFSTRSAMVIPIRRCWWFRRSIARSTSARRAPARSIWRHWRAARCCSAPPASRASARPASSRSKSFARPCSGSWRSARPRIRTCTISMASRCTAPRTRPSCPCRTGYIPMGRRIGVSPSASWLAPSRAAAHSVERESPAARRR